jgi:hypothetical protein
MPRRDAFHDLQSAPRDGTAIEIKHGPAQEVVCARWSGQGHAWVRVGDPLPRALHRVTGWRPVGAGKTANRDISPAAIFPPLSA